MFLYTENNQLVKHKAAFTMKHSEGTKNLLQSFALTVAVHHVLHVFDSRSLLNAERE